VIECIDGAHENRFLLARHRMQFDGMSEMPSDWAACLFVLTSNADRWARAAERVSAAERTIEWDLVYRGVYSHGELCMLRLANVLYNGDGGPDVAELIDTLDERNFRIAVVAIQLRRYGIGSLQIFTDPITRS
jgi:hypothetical protein